MSGRRAAGVLLLVALVGAITIWSLVRAPEGPEISTDASEMQRTTALLEQVRARLDGMPPVAATARPSYRTGCSVDGRDLFQPSARKIWQAPPAELDRVRAEVTGSLTTSGWTLEPDARLSLRLEGGSVALGVVYRADTFVGIDVEVRDARPCSNDSSKTRSYDQR